MEAKEKSQDEEQKEGIGIAVMNASISGNGYQELNESNLRNAINERFGSKAQVINNGDGTYTVKFNDTLKEYNITSKGVENGIDWKETMEQAKAPDNQTVQGVIGIGTDGKPVNMDLWEYNRIDGGYALSYESSLNASNKLAGYKGEIVDGKITTSVPMYIKDVNKGDSDFIEVISLRDTFFGINNIKYPPIIPSTINSLFETFQDCTSLEKMPIIPDKVTDMTSTFYNCQSLKELNNIPDKVTTLNYCFYNIAITDLDISLGKEVTTMKSTFLGCKQLQNIYSKLPEKVIDLSQTFSFCDRLKKAPEIPYGVQSMSGTFQYSYALETPPETIPETVLNLQWAFQNCYVLEGTIEINGCSGRILSNGYYDYAGIFVGACTKSKLILKRDKKDTVLEDIVKNANNLNITM